MNFFIFIIALVFLAYALIWWRLVLTSKLSRKVRRVIAASFVSLFFLQMGTRLLLHRKFAAQFHNPFTLTIFTLLAFVDILLFFTLLKDGVGLIAVREENPQRRLFIQRGMNLAALGLAGGASAIGAGTALKGPEIKKVDIPVSGLHPDLNGLKIAQISDLHVGSVIQKDRVQSFVNQVMALKPDLIMLTGDMADGVAAELEDATSPLAELKARYGKFYVTGNHEYYWDVDDWVARAKNLGFQFLFNEHKVLEVGRSRLLIGGVPDYMCNHIRPDHQSNPVASLKGAPPVDYKILLAHQPKSCHQAFRAGYDLQLSGHTHNGQFFPNNLIIGFFHPYVKGLNLHENKMWVYVNVGTGFWGPSQRLGVPAEITLLTLKTKV